MKRRSGEQRREVLEEQTPGVGVPRDGTAETQPTDGKWGLGLGYDSGNTDRELRLLPFS